MYQYPPTPAVSELEAGHVMLHHHIHVGSRVLLKV